MERGETMVILGIDPGLAIVGWGVLDYDRNRFRPLAYGSINTPAGMETAERLARIHRDLSAIIDRYKPTEMAVEELFFTKNITTGIRVAEARGVILMTGQEKGLTLAEYTPTLRVPMVVGTLIMSPNAHTVTPDLASVIASAISLLVVTQTGHPGPCLISTPTSLSIVSRPNLTIVS